MKKEIVCTRHAGLAASVAKTAAKHGELFLVVSGKAKREFICDDCGRVIASGEPCEAWSMARTPREHYAWEHEFIETDGGGPAAA